MESIWTRDWNKPKFPILNKNFKTDVVIIGGGMAGVLTGYMLTNAGVDCVVVEANEIAGGVTRDTTAKITLQHGLIYHNLIKRCGVQNARLYGKAQQQALAQYRKLCQTIPCDFEEKDNVVYSRTDPFVLNKEVCAMRKLGISADLTNSMPLPFQTVGGVRVSGQAQFHPLKFLSAIAPKVRIFEHTKVLAIQANGVVTNHGNVVANKIVVATHFPFFNTHGGYFLKMHQERSYVIALQGAQQVEGMYIDGADHGLSFRNYGDLLLLGGGGHRTGKPGGNWRELRRFAKRFYPDAKEVARWATQDCKTLDGMPYIGRYSKNTPNLYVATGFNKWGMTNSMVAANVLTDLVQGKHNPFAGAFDPGRSMLHKELLVNGGEALLSMITPTAPRCPHLGCALKYNRAEHSWDCPCHGSRFAEDGKLLNNPATGDKRF